MKKYQAKDPHNARIFIDYKNKKNPVKFEYPIKKRGSIFGLTFMMFLVNWGYLNMVVYFIIYLFFNVVLKKPLIIGLPTYIQLFHILFLPLVCTLYFMRKNELMGIVPKIMAYSSLFPLNRYCYKSITETKKRIVEIPLFRNIFLDYNATGEFSKYLEKVQIVEHDFKVAKRNLIFRNNKKEKQDTLWKAKFIFSKVPKKGKLEVWFK